jgi:acylphosphatase
MFSGGGKRLMMKQRVKLIVTGQVQGIGYRWFVQQEAMQEKLSGWVRNRPDGTVELEAEGDSDRMDQFINALRSAHPNARVDHIEIQRLEPLKKSAGFDIKW